MYQYENPNTLLNTFSDDENPKISRGYVLIHRSTLFTSSTIYIADMTIIYIK